MGKLAYRCVLILIVAATGTIINLPGPLASVIRVAAIPAILVTSVLILLRGSVRRLNSYYWALLAFFLWRILSYTWSVAPAETLAGFDRIFPEVVISLLVWETCRTREQTDGALQAFVLGGYILVISLAYNFAIGATSEDADRVAAGGFNPDDFLYLIPVPIAWYLATKAGTKNTVLSWLNYGYLLVAPMGIIFTAGRAAFVVALPIYAYILLSGRKAKASVKFVFTLCAVTLVFVLLNLGVESKLSRLETTITNPSAASDWGGALNGRDYLWAIAIKEFGQHPLFGTGATTFGYFSATTPAVTTIREPDNNGLPAHNTYLSILSETGMIGLFSFVMLIGITIRAALQATDRELRSAFMVAIVAMLIGISTLTYEDHIGIWLLLTLIIGSSLAADGAIDRTNQAYLPGSVGQELMTPLSDRRISRY